MTHSQNPAEEHDPHGECAAEIHRLRDELDAERAAHEQTKRGYEALDRNWNEVHQRAMRPIRKAIGNDNATVPEIIEAIEATRRELADEQAMCAAAVQQWHDLDLRNEHRHREWNSQLTDAEAQRDAARRELAEAKANYDRELAEALALNNEMRRLHDEACDQRDEATRQMDGMIKDPTLPEHLQANAHKLMAAVLSVAKERDAARERIRKLEALLRMIQQSGGMWPQAGHQYCIEKAALAAEQVEQPAKS